MPTLELDEGFESGSLSASFSHTGSPTVDATAALEGSYGLHTSGSGVQNINYLDTPASQSVAVHRFTFKIPVGGTPVGAIAILLQLHTPTPKNAQIRVNTSGVLTAIITGGAAATGPTIVEGQEYTVDVLYDCSANPHTLDWQVDGVAQPQATSANAADAISVSGGEKLGNVTAGVTAFTAYFDSWAISRTSGDYPIGAPATGALTLDAGIISSGAALHGPAVDPGVVAIAAPSIASASSATAPTSLDAGSIYELNDEFDEGFGAYTVVGSPTLDTAAPIQSGASARFAGTGTQFLKHLAPAGVTVEVFSFLYRHGADPTNPSNGAATVWVSDTTAAKSGQIRVSTAGVIQGVITGSIPVSGPTLVVGQTYLIDGRYDASAYTLEWQVDGVDQTDVSLSAGVATVCSATRIGNVNSGPTFDFTVDAARISRVYASYPLGQPAAAALVLAPGAITETPSLPGPAVTNAGNLVISVARTAATGHPNKPAVAAQLPAAPPNTYDGPRGVMLRTTSQDITGAYNARPWVDVVAAYITYASLKATAAGAYDWGGIITSLRHCIDHPGRMTAIRIEMGASCPSWIYSANSIGQCEPVHVYTGPSDSVGSDIPLPWGAETRAHWQGILNSLATLLETTYNGSQYKDVVAFVSVSNATTVGTEMTIGDAGDSRNTTAWNTYGTQTERRSLYADAWFDGLTDVRTILPDCRASVAEGTIWADARQGAKDIALRASQAWPDDLGKLMFGPTDMRVDKPGAVSYAAWSRDASDAMDYFASLGVTVWAQSAGDSWFGSGGFNVATADAVKKSYLDEGCNRYRVVLMESNAQILGKYVLDSWAQATLAPAIKALALPQTIRAGHINSTLAAHGPQIVGASATSIFHGRLAAAPQLRGGLIETLSLPAPDYIVPCYNQSVIVSSPETLIVVQEATPVIEVTL